MADDGSRQSDAVWPLPKFYFEVSWDSQIIHFQEVTGLDAESEPIEYRHGNNSVFSTINMPGIKNYQNITLNKGIIVKDNSFWDWYRQIKMGTDKRKDITIRLLDESGEPTMVWTLVNAWPIKIISTDHLSDSDTVAVETLEVAHEGLTIANA